MSLKVKSNRDRGSNFHSKKVRLPKDFHWKLMEKISIDLEHSYDLTPDDADLKNFRSCVRNRDVERYLYLCEKHWGLKQLSSVTPSDVTGNLLSDIRKKRMLTCFQKFDFPDSTVNKRENALRTFKKFEDRCRHFNNCDIFVTGDKQSTYDDVFTFKHIQKMKYFIQRTLGAVPDLDMFLCALRHGPGASTDKRGNFSIPINKFVPPIGVSPYAKLLFERILSSDERWMRSLADFLLASAGENSIVDLRNLPVCNFLKDVPSSVITTVPKSAKTDRTICIEPTANVYMQLAVDSIIRQRLKSLWRIDINTQKKNQLLAKVGSLTNKLVTVDLSGASDSICLKYLEIFPEKWRKLLLALRMPTGILPDGTTVNFQKLSAMGNGYTFAIETLIFSSIIYAVLRVENLHWKDYIDNIAVYGDDIIFPVKFYSEISYLLHKTGFLENNEKTFINGPIRESCGCDYYLGDRIDRPSFKDFPKLPYELIIMHNRLIEVGQLFGVDFSSSTTFLRSYFPSKEQFFGPICEDRTSWFFSEGRPDQKGVFYDNYLQRFFIRLRRLVIGHPMPKKCGLHFRYFIPLMYLNKYTPPLSKSLSQGSAHRPTTDDFFFQKNVVVVRTSKAIIPLEEWPSAINCN